MKSIRMVGVAAAALLWWVAPGAVNAQLPDLDPIPSIYEEPGLNKNRGHENQHATEHIDPFTGKLRIAAVDLFVPGDGGMDIAIRRAYTSQQALAQLGEPSPYGIGWTLTFGRLLRKAVTGLCAQGLLSTVSPVVELPGGGREILYDDVFDNGPKFISVNRYRGVCHADGAGMTVFAPDGMRWVFDHRGLDVRNQSAWYPSRIYDRNGNWFAFTYQRYLLFEAITGITTSDGRQVTFAYAGSGDDVRLASVTAGGRTVTYNLRKLPNFLGGGFYFLDEVIRPDGLTWRFTYDDVIDGSASDYSVVRVAYPQTGTLDYTYDLVHFYGGPASGQLFTSVVVAKTSSDGGSWTFSYRPGTRPYVEADNEAEDPASLDKTTVTTSKGTVTTWHLGHAGAMNPEYDHGIGDLLAKQTGGLQAEGYAWQVQKISNQNFRHVNGTNSFGVWASVLEAKTIGRGAGTHKTDYSDFDVHGNARTIIETGVEPFGTATRTTTITYDVKPAQWLLRLKSREFITGVGAIDRVFDDAGNVLSETRYGVRTESRHYDNGNLWTRKNARNDVWTFEDYRHGIPRRELHPEAVVVTRTVSAAGNIESETDPESATTRWTYDALNRVKSMGHPAGNDVAVDWQARSRTVTRGSYRELAEYDRFGRMTRMVVTDTSRNQSIAQVFRYDSLGNKTFESYPGSETEGVTYQHDLLGRVTRATFPDGKYRQWDDLGSSLYYRNERGFETENHFRIYGDPDVRELVEVILPISFLRAIRIERNGLGQVTKVDSAGVVRTFHYDSRYFMDSSTEPETGTTLYGRDEVGNMVSRKVGTRSETRFSYDRLNRLAAITYPAGTPGVTRGYFRDGGLRFVDNGVARREYTYDANKNLHTEILKVGGLNLAAEYGYDGNDALAAMTYGSGGRIDYAPDAFGRPTQALPYATEIAHHPSGEVARMVYANGVITTSTLNQRRWPETLSATRTGPIIGQRYTYDEVGNLTAIADDVDGSSNRTLGYDQLDRLAGATGPWGDGWTTYDYQGNILSQQFASQGRIDYGYDTATQRLSYTVGTASFQFQYDEYGNVVVDGRNTFQYDDATNLRCVDCGLGSEVRHTYDGAGMRVTTRKGDRTTYFMHGQKGALLWEITPGAEQREIFYVAGRQIAERVVAATVAQATGPVPFSMSLAASGATGATYFIVDGSLPPGLALNPATGIISGTPTQRGTFTFVYRISGGTAPAVQASAQIVVSGVASATAVPARMGGTVLVLLALLVGLAFRRLATARAAVLLLAVLALGTLACGATPSPNERAGERSPGTGGPEHATGTGEPASNSADTPAVAASVAEVARPTVARALAATGIGFEPNLGQISDKKVRFRTHGMGYEVSLEDHSVLLTLARPDPAHEPDLRRVSDPGPRPPRLLERPPEIPKLQKSQVRMKLLRGRAAKVRAASPVIEGEDPLPHRAHYYLGRDPSHFFTNVPHFAKVRYRDVYPGIDQVFYGRRAAGDEAKVELEYDFVVKPGADPGSIALAFEGAEQVALDEGGNLRLSTVAGELRQLRPVAYQVVAGARVPVEARYEVRADGKVTFALGPHDAQSPLVIDPVFAFSTYIPGAYNNHVRAVAVDPAGNAYVLATQINIITSTPWEEISTKQIYLAKVDATGALVYYAIFGGQHTFYSATAGGLAVDAAGNAYIAGSSLEPGSNFPLVTPFQASYGGGRTDGVVAKVAPDGTTILWSSFLGGAGDDEPTGIALDGQGRVHVTGVTRSANFPRVGGIQSTCTGDCSGDEGFITRIAAGGLSIEYSTFLGGDGYDRPEAMAVDSSGHAVVAGKTGSANFPRVGGVQASCANACNLDDAFVTKLAPDGASIVFSTFLGGQYNDRATTIRVDGSGAVYVGGETGSADFPATAVGAGWGRAFVTKLTADGGVKIFSSRLLGAESVWAMAIDAQGRASVVGRAVYDAGGFVDPLQPEGALLVATLSASGGALSFASRFGVDDMDYRSVPSIAVDGAGALLVAASTSSTRFPMIFAAHPYGPNLGRAAIVLVRIEPGSPRLLLSTAPTPLDDTGPCVLRGQIAGATGEVVFMEGERELGRAPLSGGQAELTLNLARGDRLVHALYPGNATVPRAASNIFRIIVRGSSTTTLSTYTSEVNAGAAIRLDIAVTGSSYPNQPTGDVTVKEGTTVIARDQSGNVFLPPGEHRLRAEYPGDERNRPSVSNELVVRVRAPPAVAIVAPPPNAEFGVNTPIAVTVTASTADAVGIQKVELYAGGFLKGQDFAAPYEFTVTGLVIGSHTLSARATDNRSSTSTSVAVPIKVVALTRPEVTWVPPTPAAGSTLPALSSVSLAAGALVPVGRTVTQVRFDLNGQPLATDTSAPYEARADRLVPGSYTINATATDSTGATGQAPPLALTIAPGETVRYLHTDLAGSPIAATDAGGNLLWRESYRPFGEREKRQLASLDQRQFFHGKPEEPGGLQYFQARYYNPSLGRFYGVDPKPWTEADPHHTFNRYAYGNNNPYQYKDPDGQAVETVIDIASFALSLHAFRKDPSILNGLGLAYDGIALAIPVLPGGIGIVRHGAKAADAAKAGDAAGDATRGLQQRADEIHAVLDPRAQRARTTAVTEAVGPDGSITRVVSSSERRLSPAQRRALGAGEVEGVGVGHAEVTGVEAARRMGLTPTQTAASRPICPNCASTLESSGVAPASPLRKR